MAQRFGKYYIFIKAIKFFESILLILLKYIELSNMYDKNYQFQLVNFSYKEIAYIN